MTQLNDWLPMGISRTGTQFAPLQLMVIINKDEEVHFDQFFDCYKVPLRVYLREALNGPPKGSC